MTTSAWWGEDIVPRIQWRIEIAEGEEIPDGYGIAYYEPWRPRAICMPLPLNLIVGFWRACLHWLRMPPWRLVEFRDTYAQASGWERGYDDATMDAHFASSTLMFPKRHNPFRCAHCSVTR